MDTIYSKIKQLRKKVNLTQIEFSERIGITQGYLSAIEKGSIENIGGNIFIAIKKEFGIDLTGDTLPDFSTAGGTDRISQDKISQATPRAAANRNGVQFFEFSEPAGEIWIQEWLTPVANGGPTTVMDDKITFVNATKHLHNKSFYVEAKGRSMEGAGIKEGMRLLVDRSIEPAHGKIVLAAVDGEYTIKRIKANGKWWLLHPDPDSECDTEFPCIECNDDVQIIGVVVEAKLMF